MKSTWTLLTALALAIGGMALTGCEEEAAEPTAPVDTTTPGDPVTPAEPGTPGEPADTPVDPGM